jgi:hypothetical protein
VEFPRKLTPEELFDSMGARASLVLILATSFAIPARSQDAGPVEDTPAEEAPAEEAAAPAEEAPAEEAPAEAPAPVEPAPVAPPPPPPPPPEPEPPKDTEPPFIEDVAVASTNPDAAPMVTAIITDKTGVEKASVFFRRPGTTAFAQMSLSPGEDGLFLVRLPEGTQNSGFQYYVYATDGTNETSLGSEDDPFDVDPAVEGTLARLERERRLAEQPEIHPAWVMFSLGAGILAGAGSGAFFYDWGVLQQEIADIDEDLATPGLDPALQAAFLVARDDRITASTGDLIFGGVLGIIAVVGLGTGVGLLVASGLEE